MTGIKSYDDPIKKEFKIEEEEEIKIPNFLKPEEDDEENEFKKYEHKLIKNVIKNSIFIQ